MTVGAWVPLLKGFQNCSNGLGGAKTGCGTEMVARKNVSEIKKLAGGFVGESRGVSG